MRMRVPMRSTGAEQPVVVTRSHENESTDARHRGGATRSSDEVCVMQMERRGCIDQLYDLVNR
jgi:hypothetical protein